MLNQGSNFSFPSKGIWISLFAGALGAIGAFGILLAFGARARPGGHVDCVRRSPDCERGGIT